MLALQRRKHQASPGLKCWIIRGMQGEAIKKTDGAERDFVKYLLATGEVPDDWRTRNGVSVFSDRRDK